MNLSTEMKVFFRQQDKTNKNLAEPLQNVMYLFELATVTESLRPVRLNLKQSNLVFDCSHQTEFRFGFGNNQLGDLNVKVEPTAIEQGCVKACVSIRD